MEFKVIKGLVGKYQDNEILVDSEKSDPKAVDAMMTYLTAEDKGVVANIKRLEKLSPYNEKHALKIKQDLETLQDQVIRRYYAVNDEGFISVPPGFYYLFESFSEGICLGKIPLSITKVGERDARYYQVDSVTEAFKYKRAMIVLPTGSGKAFCVAAMTKSLVDKKLRVLVIVPTINLVRQIISDISLVVDKKTISGIGGTYKFKEGSQVVVATINSGKNYSDIFDAVIIDESHRSASNSYLELATFANKAVYFYGLTATPVRGDGLELGFHAILGKVVYEMSSRQAIVEGFLCPVSVTCVTIRGLGSVRPGTNDQVAYKHFSTHEKTLHYMKDLVKSAISKGLKVLVLFKTVEPGVEFCEYMSAHGIESSPAHSKYQKPYFDFKDGKTNLLVSNSSLLGEGVDIPEIDFLISIVQNSSESLTRQIIGRGLRLKKGGRKLRFVDITTAGFAYKNTNKDGSVSWFDILVHKGKQRKKIYEDITDDIVSIEV